MKRNFKKLYQKVCRVIEDCFYQFTGKQLILVLIGVIWAVFILFKIAFEPILESKKADPYFQLIVAFIPFLIIGWFFRRAWCTAIRKNHDQSIKHRIAEAPLNWDRFKLKAYCTCPVLDFDEFDRNLVYIKLPPYQQAISDKDFISRKLQPIGWTFQEFQVNYDSNHKKFGDYHFYFRKNKNYICVTANQHGYSVSYKYLKYFDEECGIGLYSKVENQTISCLKIERLLKGDQYG